MNTYLVVSEELTTVVWEDWFNYVGHEEDYRIAELVVANKRSQAMYLAWKADESFSNIISDMPKMAARIAQKDVDGPPRILDDPHSDLWNTEISII